MVAVLHNKGSFSTLRAGIWGIGEGRDLRGFSTVLCGIGVAMVEIGSVGVEDVVNNVLSYVNL